MLYDLFRASLITGIERWTLRNHIIRGWLDARKTDKKWFIDTYDLLEYAGEQWERGRLLMYPPSSIPGRMDVMNNIDKDRRQRENPVKRKPKGGPPYQARYNKRKNATHSD